MNRSVLVLVLMSACSFPRPQEGTVDGPVDSDGATCKSGFVDLCGQASPDGNFIVSDAQINTDSDARCRTVTQAGGPNVCLFYFNDVEIQAGGTVLAYGSRPFALVATNEMRINGVLDVSSQRARPTLRGAGSNPSGLCTFVSFPEIAAGGGGGGAGGSFGTAGGTGGNGNLDGSDTSAANRAGGRPGTVRNSPGLLRGGCDGQDGGYGDPPNAGVAGQGGGAVYLSSPELFVTGIVRAGGSGGSVPTGDSDGGGGGGSGGGIILEGDLINVAGRLIATGGGGAKGANGPSDGAAGGDGTDITPAPGGGGGGGGPGGNGATDSTGGNGMPNNGGGGGGGGGAGFVVLLSRTPMTEGALIMPPATNRAR